MDVPDITIVIVRALGLSGATWFNLVLGSNKVLMAMGPPARILDLDFKDAGQACFIHREHCLLWPQFFKSGTHEGSFFRDLADFTGKKGFILNYPPRNLIDREVSGKDFNIKNIKLVRDGRACLYSYMRHYGTGKPGSAIEHIINWQIPKMDQVDRKINESGPENSITVKHEDMLFDPGMELERIGKFIGFKYTDNATRFWEYEHHMTAGNTGVLDLLCQMQGLPGHNNKRSEVYRDLAERLRVNPTEPYIDKSWESGLSREDRIAFECLLGERNQSYGYERDEISTSERIEFMKKFDYYNKYTL